MTRTKFFLRGRSLLTLALVAVVGTVSASCGGGGGGSEGAGRGLVLLSFRESAVDNVTLNQRLEFQFSEAVDDTTINNAAIQIRQGPSFGLTVAGTFVTQGSTVIFEPRLPSLCDLSDSGFQPATRYRVQLMGFPEQFAVRNQSGQSLSNTQTYEFFTRADTDPEKFSDQIPGVGPVVLSSSPANGDQAVPVEAGNRIEMIMSENLDPCTVNDTTVLVDIYEQGDPTVNATAPNGRTSGFSSNGADNGDTADQLPNDPFSWGSVGTTSFSGAPRRILCDIQVEQTFAGTKITATPLLGLEAGAPKFPENVLIVVTLTFDIEDFGNLAMTPTTLAFTTENLAAASETFTIENKGEVEYDRGLTTAAVPPDARAPERAQAYMLFAGDGDNGIDQNLPSLPETPGSGCTLPRQANDNLKDDFDPIQDILFDTGATANTCPNETDGSTAVVWQFNSFRIRNGITVRFIGANPAIILVLGDVTIETGGRLMARGDNQGGAPRGAGASGYANRGGSGGGGNGPVVAGGTGVAGAGNGGNGGRNLSSNPPLYGDDGESGYGSSDPVGTVAGEGAGLGGVRANVPNSSAPWPSGSGQGGGGGGHAEDGGTSTAFATNGITLAGPPKGTGGITYGGDRMPQAEAGGGGGGAGFSREISGSFIYHNGGGAGGAGGGFIDLTSSGNIFVFGTVDASGSRGGDGGQDTFYGAGGGGAGAGGGVRLLTPNDINVSNGTVTAAGGPGGTATFGTGANLPPSMVNHGGDGGNGRVVMEDGDSVITGLNVSNVTPGEGTVGFFRGIFDASRFQGGGLRPVAQTLPIVIGNHAGFNPEFGEPSVGDFKVGVPVVAAPGVGSTALVIEVRGTQMADDGTLDAGSTTPFVTVGHFTDSGVETNPNWNFGLPPALDWTPPTDNNGQEGFAALNALGGGDGFEYLEVRFSFILPTTVGPFDGGAFLDDWTIHYTHDN